MAATSERIPPALRLHEHEHGHVDVSYLNIGGTFYFWAADCPALDLPRIGQARNAAEASGRTITPRTCPACRPRGES